MRRLAVALAVIALLAACSDSKKPGGPAISSASIGGPAVGGTLRVGIERPRTLDPALVSPGSQSELLAVDLLFDGLTRLPDNAVTASPAIATAWVSSPDLKAWQFALRADALFSNGRAITATDVKYSLERVAKLGETSLAALRIDQIHGFGPLITGAATELTGVRVVDDHTLGIDLDTPLAILPELLSAPEYGIVPKEAVEAATPKFSSAPVTSGPFSYAGAEGDTVKLVRATQGGAYLDAIELHQYDTQNVGTAYDAFIAGNLDWSVVPNDRAEDAAQRFGVAGFRPFDAQLFYAFNLLDPKFADVRFRQAIVKAIDRAAIVSAVYPGIADLLNGVVPAGVAGHVDDPCGDPCKFDPDGSRALLAAGVSGRQHPRHQPRLLHRDRRGGGGRRDRDEPRGRRYQRDEATERPRRRAGTVRPLRRQRAAAAVPARGHRHVRVARRLPHAAVRVRVACDNATGFADANADQLLGTARSTADPAARQQLYQQAEQLIMAVTPIVPIAQFRTKSVVSPRVRDLVVTVNGTFAGDKVWLEG